MGRRIQGCGRHDAALLRPGPRLRLRAVVEALHARPVRRREPPRRLLRRPLLRLRLRRAHGPLRAQLPSPGRRRPVQARRDAGPRRLGRRDHAMLLSPQRRRQARWQRRGAGLLVVHHRVLAGDAEQHAGRGRAAAGRHVRRLGARPRRADIDGADHRLLPAAAAGLRGEAGLRWRRREAGTAALPASEDNDVEDGSVEGRRQRQPVWPLVRAVGLKVARNPNVYAGVLGVAWSCVTNRWHIRTPSIIEGSVLIMSRTGVGLAMFSMGLFMALQEKIIDCGAGMTVLGMALRFVAGPAATAAGAVALGLRRDVLRLAIIQAALPQSITTWVFAKEYGLHADVLSTAIIFGTLASLPVLIVYYIVLGFVG